MKRDVHEFIKELAEYINTFVAGRDGSCITECIVKDELADRGHAIPVKCRPYEGEYFGPCFYAEELMQQFPYNTVAMIAETIAAKTESLYPDMIASVKRQKEVSKKNIKDIGQDNIYLSSDMRGPVTRTERETVIIRQHKGTGIVSMIKAGVTDKDHPDRIQLMTIRKDRYCPATRKDWKRAEENSLSKALISMHGIGLKKDGMPLCGKIKDEAQFYSYFYLLTPGVWQPLIEKTKAEKIYIFPNMGYAAEFTIDNEAVSSDQEFSGLRAHFTDRALEKMSGDDVFVLDCKTMKVTKFDVEEGDECED